jgi:hypothetical protein
MNVGIVKEEGESSSYVRQTDSGSSGDPTSGGGFVRDGLTLGGETAATTTFVASAAAATAAANHGTSGGVTSTIGAAMILNYIQSSNFIELCCCFGLLIAGMVVEFRGIPLNQRPLPFVQLQSTGEYIVNQMFNETFDGETVPSKWKHYERDNLPRKPTAKDPSHFFNAFFGRSTITPSSPKSQHAAGLFGFDSICRYHVRKTYLT